MGNKDKRPGAPQSYQATTVVHTSKKHKKYRKRKHKNKEQDNG